MNGNLDQKIYEARQRRIEHLRRRRECRRAGNRMMADRAYFHACECQRTINVLQALRAGARIAV